MIARLDQVPKIHCPDEQVSSLYRFVATGKEQKFQGIFSPLDLATTKEKRKKDSGFSYKSCSGKDAAKLRQYAQCVISKRIGITYHHLQKV
jgi:hypothetical protein